MIQDARKAARSNGKKPLKDLERLIIGCWFSGCWNHEVRPYHFRSELKGHILAAHEVLRRECALHPIPGGQTVDDIPWRILTAETNAATVCKAIVDAGWWKSLTRAWDEMRHCLGIYECPLDYRPGICQQDIDDFPLAVDQLIEQYELREELRRTERAQEDIRRRLLEVCA